MVSAGMMFEELGFIILPSLMVMIWTIIDNHRQFKRPSGPQFLPRYHQKKAQRL